MCDIFLLLLLQCINRLFLLFILNCLADENEIRLKQGQVRCNGHIRRSGLAQAYHALL